MNRDDDAPSYTDLSFLFGGVDVISFFTPYFDKEDKVSYPFGGVSVLRHIKGEDIWRVNWHSPDPNKKFVLPLKHEKFGYLIPSQVEAVKLARKFQP